MRRGVVLVGLLLSLVLAPAGSRPQGPEPPPSFAGQTATLLPDGRWLLAGGLDVPGPRATLEMWDPQARTLTPLAASLQVPRAWHTATVLPDGRVAVIGGLDDAGQAVGLVELVDPATGQVTPRATPGLAARVRHTATVLTDGRVLLAGGIGADGTTLGELVLWDPMSGLTAPAGVTLATPRHSHAATLEADGGVLLWGGAAADGTPLADGERYDLGGPMLSPVTAEPTPPAGPPQLTGALPPDQSTGVAVDAILALRFSGPLDVTTVTPDTITLAGPAGRAVVQVVPVEGGRLAFLTPPAALTPGTTYVVTLNGPRAATGEALPFTTVAFTAASAPAAGVPATAEASAALADAGGAGTATTGRVADEAGPWTGEWRDGKPYSPWQSLAPLTAPAGVTALAGQVLRGSTAAPWPRSR